MKSSALGIAREYAFDAKHAQIIDIGEFNCSRRKKLILTLVGELQADLQMIGSAIATPRSSATERKMNQVEFKDATQVVCFLWGTRLLP